MPPSAELRIALRTENPTSDTMPGKMPPKAPMQPVIPKQLPANSIKNKNVFRITVSKIYIVRYIFLIGTSPRIHKRVWK